MSDDIHSKLDRLDVKIDGLNDRLGDVNVRLAEYNSELTRHIEGVQLAREENKLLKEFVHKEIEPIKDHVKMVNWTLRVLVAIGATLVFLNELGLLDTIK